MSNKPPAGPDLLHDFQSHKMEKQHAPAALLINLAEKKHATGMFVEALGEERGALREALRASLAKANQPNSTECAD